MRKPKKKIFLNNQTKIADRMKREKKQWTYKETIKKKKIKWL